MIYNPVLQMEEETLLYRFLYFFYPLFSTCHHLLVRSAELYDQ